VISGNDGTGPDQVHPVQRGVSVDAVASPPASRVQVPAVPPMREDPSASLCPLCRRWTVGGHACSTVRANPFKGLKEV
jgi:hypothetical protein